MKKINHLSATMLLTATLVGGSWQSLSAQNWLTAGNAVAAGQFLGSTNAADVIFRTSNADRMRITAAGRVGIGITAPSDNLDVFQGMRVTDGNSIFARLYVTATRSEFLNNGDHVWFTRSSNISVIGFSGSTSANFLIYANNENPASNIFTATAGRFVGIRTLTPSSVFQVAGGQISQLQAGAFGNFATGNEWIGLGLAGTQAVPITSTFGVAMARGASAGYFNLVNSTTFIGTEDLIVGFGGEGAALDANQRMRVRSIRTNGVNIPVTKDLMVFNAAGYVGVNADPANIAFLVDATTTAIPATNSFRAITVLSNGSFSTPANVVASTFSSIGQERQCGPELSSQRRYSRNYLARFAVWKPGVIGHQHARSAHVQLSQQH
jgi:hypothetical protein